MNRPEITKKFRALVSESIPSLPTETMEKWLAAGKKRSLRKLLKKAFLPEKIRFSPTLRLVLGKRKSLKRSESVMKIKGFDEGLRKLIKFSTTEKKIDVVLLQPFTLSKKINSVEELYAKAKAAGLKLCPPETAIEYLLQAKGYGLGECIRVSINNKRIHLCITATNGASIHKEDNKNFDGFDSWLFVQSKR